MRKSKPRCGFCVTGRHDMHRVARPCWSPSKKDWWLCECPEPDCALITTWWRSRLPAIAGPQLGTCNDLREWWQYPEEGAVICKPCMEGGDANAKGQYRKAKNRHKKCVDPLHCPCHHEVGAEGYINFERVNKK